MKVYLLALFFVVTLFSGCAIKQTVEPSDIDDSALLCIVENYDVRDSFLKALTEILDERQVRYKIVGAEASKDCEWRMTYTARWSWDLALYMAYARINVYKNGDLDGQAIYDATQGAGSLDKFIDAESKLRELIDELMAKKQ